MNNETYPTADDRTAKAQLKSLFEGEELEQCLDFVSDWDDYYREWEPVQQ
jgi:hypothetical protein